MLIDGKKIAAKILENISGEISRLSFHPVFCDVVVGDDPVSLSYVGAKAKAASSVGVEFKTICMPADVSETDLVEKIHECNQMQNICGLIVQLPLPVGLNRETILNAIDPSIDVDCLTDQNHKLLYSGQIVLPPPTAAAVLKILDSLKEDLSKKKFLIVGQGDLVGKPLAALLKTRGYNFSVADRTTKNLRRTTLSADVVISGTGSAGLITGDFVSEGSIVIDAGTAEMDGGIAGDVEKATVVHKAAWLSSVPGGVGPVTVATLLSNVLAVAQAKNPPKTV